MNNNHRLAAIASALRGQVEIILSTPRAFLGHQCKARFAGNGRSLTKKRNAAVMAQVRPNVNIISTCLLTIALSGTANADEYHYTNILVGDRAAGMGGAYTAISDDPSGLYYNPAGIAYARSSNLSASVNAFNSTSTTYNSALGGSRDWTRTSSSLLPNFFGIVQPLGKGVVGFSYAVPDVIEEDQDQVFGGFPSGLNATTVTSYTINFNQNDTTYKFGPSYAYPVNDKLSLGVTLYYHNRDVQRIQNEYVIVDNTEGGGYEWTSRYKQTQEHGLQPTLGLMWSPTDRLALGLTASRNYILGSESTLQTSYHIDASYLDTSDTQQTLNSITAPTIFTHEEKRELPLQLRLGMAWFHSDRLLISADITHNSAHDYEDIELDISGLPVTIAKRREAVTDIALGAEYYLNSTWALRGGIYTSNANTPEIDDSSINQEEHVDVTGFTGSISRYTRNSSLTFGLGYGIGSGRAQLFSGTTSYQEVDSTSLTAFLSTSYSY